MGAEERDIDADVAEPQDDVTAAGEPESGTQPATDGISRRRLIGVDVLIGLTTILLVVAIFATWANRLLFSPDNWSKTSTQLLQNENVRASTANYVVDQLYANVDVAGLLKQGLAHPVPGAGGSGRRRVAQRGCLGRGTRAQPAPSPAVVGPGQPSRGPDVRRRRERRERARSESTKAR